MAPHRLEEVGQRLGTAQMPKDRDQVIFEIDRPTPFTFGSEPQHVGECLFRIVDQSMHQSLVDSDLALRRRYQEVVRGDRVILCRIDQHKYINRSRGRRWRRSTDP